jgi:hypothetical protein
MEFYNITGAALNGTYDGRDANLFASKPWNVARLRARVHMENESFASYMKFMRPRERFAMTTGRPLAPMVSREWLFRRRG